MMQLISHAQNLVLNGSFETHSDCPPDISDPCYKRYIEFATGWMQPTCGTPDFFHTCGSKSAKVPQNAPLLGFKLPRTGNGMAGVIAYNTKTDTLKQSIIEYYVEYIQTELAKPLEADKYYQIKYYVSPSVNFKTSYSDQVTGGNFSVVQPYIDSDRSYLLTASKAQIINQKGRILNDPNVWYEICGTYQATGGERYLTIGNFLPFSDIEIKGSYDNCNDGICNHTIYLFIDDISVSECGKPQTPFLPGDKTLCGSEKLDLNADLKDQYDSTWWNTGTKGTKGTKYTVTMPGIYQFNAAQCGCIFNDTINIQYRTYTPQKLDTMICEGDYLNISIPGYGNTITNPSGQKVTDLRSEGDYIISLVKDVCTFKDTLHLRYDDCNLHIPNVFTPNDDHVNDDFYIRNVTKLPWTIKIYNRWGVLVYESTQYDNSWKALHLTDGVYYYFLSNNKFFKQYKGWVEVVR